MQYTLEDGFEETQSLCIEEEGLLSISYNSGAWDAEVSFELRSPDDQVLFFSSLNPFAGLNHQQQIYFDDYAACGLRSKYVSGLRHTCS